MAPRPRDRQMRHPGSGACLNTRTPTKTAPDARLRSASGGVDLQPPRLPAGTLARPPQTWARWGVLTQHACS